MAQQQIPSPHRRDLGLTATEAALAAADAAFSAANVLGRGMADGTILRFDELQAAAAHISAWADVARAYAAAVQAGADA